MKRRYLLLVLGLFVLGLFMLLTCLPVRRTRAQGPLPLDRIGPPDIAEGVGSTADLDWLEPRGLNIVDMVGFVPEEYLEEAIISYTPGYGILVYQAGTRVGDTVTITATVYPRYFKTPDGAWSGSLFGCLGQPARIDQWGSVAPATTMRLYYNREDVTSQVDLYTYVPAGRTQPIRNPRQSENENQYRYWETEQSATEFTPDGALSLPANMGCELIMSYKNYRQLTAVFVAQIWHQVSVEVVGSETFTFHSYMGPGYAGVIAPLVGQLSGSRHEKFPLDVPAEADYFLLNFPPMPVDPYTMFPGNPTGNVDRPVGGTYRIMSDGFSVDHVNTMGLPLYRHWKDMDQSGSVSYLPHFKWPSKLASPEYFVPAGVEYDPCMLQGNCSDELLQAIRDTTMTMRIVYLRVQRTGCAMDRIPLRMVGPVWSPSAAASNRSLDDGIESCWGSSSSGGTVNSVGTLTYSHYCYLPIISHRFCAYIPPDDPTGCPCGWFTDDGRMVDFVPHP